MCRGKRLVEANGGVIHIVLATSSKQAGSTTSVIGFKGVSGRRRALLERMPWVKQGDSPPGPTGFQSSVLGGGGNNSVSPAVCWYLRTNDPVLSVCVLAL